MTSMSYHFPEWNVLLKLHICITYIHIYFLNYYYFCFSAPMICQEKDAKWMENAIARIPVLKAKIQEGCQFLGSANGASSSISYVKGLGVAEGVCWVLKRKLSCLPLPKPLDLNHNYCSVYNRFCRHDRNEQPPPCSLPQRYLCKQLTLMLLCLSACNLGLGCYILRSLPRSDAVIQMC